LQLEFQGVKLSVSAVSLWLCGTEVCMGSRFVFHLLLSYVNEPNLEGELYKSGMIVLCMKWELACCSCLSIPWQKFCESVSKMED